MVEKSFKGTITGKRKKTVRMLRFYNRILPEELGRPEKEKKDGIKEKMEEVQKREM
jgi:hypothetical protein